MFESLTQSQSKVVCIDMNSLRWSISKCFQSATSVIVRFPMGSGFSNEIGGGCDGNGCVSECEIGQTC